MEILKFFDLIKNSCFYLLAADESTDNVNMAQLSVYILCVKMILHFTKKFKEFSPLRYTRNRMTF